MLWLKRRARESNPQLLAQRLISNQLPNHSVTLRRSGYSLPKSVVRQEHLDVPLVRDYFRSIFSSVRPAADTSCTNPDFSGSLYLAGIFTLGLGNLDGSSIICSFPPASVEGGPTKLTATLQLPTGDPSPPSLVPKVNLPLASVTPAATRTPSTGKKTTW